MAEQPDDHTPVKEREPPSVWLLFLIFARISLTSFGGGVSGWLLREFVVDRPWLTEDEFLNGLAIAQALPGVNVKNMAIWIGYKLRGPPGAVAGFVGIILPAAVVIVVLAGVFNRLIAYQMTHVVLIGAAAAAIGLSLSMGLTTAKGVPRRLAPYVVLVGTFFTVAILHWSIVWVVLGFGVASVVLSYRAQGRRTDG